MNENKGTEGAAAADQPAAEKWTAWSVVEMTDGTFRCKRTAEGQPDKVEYREVPTPVFTPAEVTAMVEFGRAGLLTPTDITALCYRQRGLIIARDLCRKLNTPVAQGAEN